jgi:hypothetical protein
MHIASKLGGNKINFRHLGKKNSIPQNQKLPDNHKTIGEFLILN